MLSLARPRRITPCSSPSLVRRAPIFCAGSKFLLRRLVGDELDRADQADAAHLAHQRVVGEALARRSLLQMRADFRDMADDVDLVVDLQRLDRDGRRHRMAGIGEAVAPGADRWLLPSASPWKTRSFTITGADRQVGRGQRLGAGQDVRLDVEGLAAPVVAGAPEAADHLVGDEQHVVLLQHGLDLLEVGGAAGRSRRPRPSPARRRRRRTVSGPSRDDRCSSSSAQARGEGLLGLAGLGAVVVVRRRRHG